LEEMPKTINAINEDESVRALLFQSTGKAFCVGLDLELLKKAFSEDSYFTSVLERLREIYLDLENLPIPTVCKVEGLARAGGFELMLSCDIVYLSDMAKIGDNHTHFSVPPGGGSTSRLPKLIGNNLAKEIIMTADWLDPFYAEKIGLVNKVYDSKEIDSKIDELLEKLIQKPRSVHRTVKKMIKSSLNLTSEEGTLNEIEIFKKYAYNESDAKEGFFAFVEGRDPNWKIKN
jgi:enoyl-CoA hydratase/carnithine racemase